MIFKMWEGGGNKNDFSSWENYSNNFFTLEESIYNSSKIKKVFIFNSSYILVYKV